jgi:hypothetical protein
MATSTNPHLIQSPFGFDSTTAEVIDGIDLFAIVGRYFEGCNQARVLDPDVPNTTISGVAVYALDPPTRTGCRRYPSRCSVCSNEHVFVEQADPTANS